MQGMASIRRNTAAIQRDGSVKNGKGSLDTSPSPKLSHSSPLPAVRGLLRSMLRLLDVVMLSRRFKSACKSMLLHRHSRPLERSRMKGFSWKSAALNLSFFFILGIVIGSMPLFSVDVSQNFASEREDFSLGEEAAAKSVRPATYSVEKELVLIDKPPVEGNSSASMWDVKDEHPDGSSISLPLDLVARKLLIIVTITYVRPSQAYCLNRLAHILGQVSPPLLWIVVGRYYLSLETDDILRATGITYRHFACLDNTNSTRKIIACQRNVALNHIRKHHLDGIVYFADEDRTYSADLFEEMRKIRRFGTWPVAVLTDPRKTVLVEGPLCKGNQVKGWQTNQRSRLSRRFHIGYSGFAFNSTIIWDRKRWNRPSSRAIKIHRTGKSGLQESRFIEQLVPDESHMEGLADNCTRIMVWQFNSEAPRVNHPTGWLMADNLEVLQPLT